MDESHPLAAPIYARIGGIENRLDRIEQALHVLLTRIRIPGIDTFEPKKVVTIDSGPAQPAQTAQTAASGPYSYQPLDATKSEIRILALDHQAQGTEPITGELIHVSLDEAQLTSLATSANRLYSRAVKMYTALSYTWGEPNQDGTVVIDGKKLAVTRNLEGALRRMRSSRLPIGQTPQAPIKTFYWIDQICINQSDIEERNAQVLLMRRIYKTAPTVVVWLGDEADDSGRAIELFSRLGAPNLRAPGQKEVSYAIPSAEEVLQNWKALDLFFQRPWWSRSWIRQEVALKNHVKVYCGEATCGLDLIGRTVQVLNQLRVLGYVPPLSPPGSPTAGILNLPVYHYVEPLQDLRQSCLFGSKYAELPGLLMHMRSCQATDLRDKVFSVLGLADPDIYKIHVDYKLPLREVLIDATRAVLPTKRGIDVFSACQNPERRNGLPSWVPNLLDAWKAHPLRPTTTTNKVSYHDAEVKFDGDALLVKGFIWGTVGEVCPDAVSGGSTPDEVDAVYAAWQRFVDRALSHKDVHSLHKRFITRELQSRGKERGWLRFLSVGHDAGLGPKYGEDGQLVADTPEDIYREYTVLNLKWAQAFLTPSEFECRVHVHRRIHAHMLQNCVGRRLCVSERGVIGLLPADARVGDTIVLFNGASFPHVIRKTGDHDDYVLVGDAHMPEHRHDYSANEGRPTEFVRLV